MARIELRNAFIRFIDGYSNTGNVNDMSIASGDSTLTVNNITGQIPALTRFTIAGVNRKYQVISATGNPTTSITFSPTLLTADTLPSNSAAITFAGRFIEVKVGDGNFTYKESRNLEYVLDRGNLDSVREGDQIPVAFTLDFVWEFITASSGDTPTLDDVLKHVGEASGWESSDADSCAPFALDLEIEHVPPCEDAQRETLLLTDARWDDLDHDLSAASVAITGRANVTQAVASRADF